MSGPGFRRPPDAAVLMHVALLSSDLDESLRFYRDGLGFGRTYQWATSSTPDGVVVYRGRGALVELGGHTYLELLAGPVESVAGPMHHLAVCVPDVDEAYRRCLAAGGLPIAEDGWSGEPISVVIDGEPVLPVRDAFVRGPSGEVIELYDQRGPIVAH